MLSRVHSTHACTLHACAVVELRFVTERKRNKNKNKNEAEFIPRAFPSESPSKNGFCLFQKNPVVRFFSSFARYELTLNPFCQPCPYKILT